MQTKRMVRFVVALLMLTWLGTAQAAPCEQPDLAAGIRRGQLWYQPQLTFEDGSAVRVRPQQAPANVRLAIAADSNEWIAIEGDFDPTAKYIGVEVDGYTMLTTPDQRYVCSRGIVLYDTLHDAHIFSIDRYGNRSETVTKTVTAIGGRREVHYKCGAYGAMMIMGSLMIAGFVFVMVVAAGVLRKRGPGKVPVAGVVPLLAENVARTVVRGYWIKLAVAVLTLSGLWTFDHPYLAFQLSPVVLVWFICVVDAWFVLRKVEARIQALGKHGNWLLVGSHKLYVPGRVWRKASSLPTAGLA